MILLKDISKSFNQNSPNEVLALNNINLNINAKDFLILVGSNGSGKSTLLNLIAGNCFATKGQILFNDNDVTKLQDFKRAKWLSRVFQNPLQGTAADLSILDNFRLAANRTKSKKLTIGTGSKFEKIVKDKISILNLGLENKIYQQVANLSGGQRQALTLLMSVMDNCKILLLDEPTAALDPKSAFIVMETANNLIKELELTAILVTHNLKEATSYGNRIIQMNQGCIIKDLSCEEKNKLTSANILNWF